MKAVSCACIGARICRRYNQVKKLLIFIQKVYESDDYLVDEGLNKHIKEVIGNIVNKKAGEYTTKIREESDLANKFFQNAFKEKDNIIKELEEENKKLKEKKEVSVTPE